VLSLLIGVIIALFAFLGSLVGDSALPSLQTAQDNVVAVLSEVLPEEPAPNSNDENGDGEGENSDGEENGNDNGDGEDGNGNDGGQKPDTTKVAAYNTAAGFALPALIPQIAIDNSPVLISCDEEEADCEDTKPGNSGETQENGGNGKNGSENNNGSLGLAIAQAAKSKDH